MPSNLWVVEIVETDEFGWTPRLEDKREFKTELEAKRFVTAYNKKRRKGIVNPQNFLGARNPVQPTPPIENNRVDPPTDSDPDEDEI